MDTELIRNANFSDTEPKAFISSITSDSAKKFAKKNSRPAKELSNAAKSAISPLALMCS